MRKFRFNAVMRLLIAYDGSSAAEAAIDDLASAGLPKSGEAEVITVAEVWLPLPSTDDASGDDSAAFINEMTEKYREHGERGMGEAEMFARHACARVQTALPAWSVDSTAIYGSPALEIIRKADDIAADLIVVGSNGRSSLSRLILGSIAQKVLSEASCSVRIARGKIEVDPSPQRILVAFDGSKGAKSAVAAVANRNWSEGSEVRLVTVSDPATPSAIGRFVPPVIRPLDKLSVSETALLETQSASSLRILERAGLRTGQRVLPGNPKAILKEEAVKWRADCVFLGANMSGSSFERFLIGSTSAAVAARAQCSVEVVRVRQNAQFPSCLTV